MLVGIHQPHYLPWLRYFEKIARSDVFIVLDVVDYTKNGWQNRNKIKTQYGVSLLTVPVHAHLATPIHEIRIDNRTRWSRKHLTTILQSYAHAPYLAEHRPFLEDVYGRVWERLCDLNRYMLDYFLRVLGIQTAIRYASDMHVAGTATERLISLMQAAGGTRYYSGAYALEVYLDANQLQEAGIELVLQRWHPPVYPQLHGAFAADLSILDLLLNCGPASLRVLLGERS